ncbi:MAG: hypothetical protein AAGA75_11685 [Cyanobacteria bacterium P01_E01_bin.6]
MESTDKPKPSILGNKWARRAIALALIGGAAMCSAPSNDSVADETGIAPDVVEEAETVDDEDVSEGAQLVSDTESGAAPAEHSIKQGMVQTPDECVDLSRCSFEWALQTMGQGVQVRADELWRISRTKEHAEIWLTQHLESNVELLRAEGAGLGHVFDGSAYQNDVSNERAQEIAATAIALNMLKNGKAPTGEANSTRQLLAFAEVLLDEQRELYPQLTQDAREQLQAPIQEGAWSQYIGGGTNGGN